jgi:hypothetical protein
MHLTFDFGGTSKGKCIRVAAKFNTSDETDILPPHLVTFCGTAR